MCRGGERKLEGYGDLGAGTRAGGGDAADEPIGDVDEACGVGAEAPGWSMRRRAQAVAIALHGQSHPESTVADQRRRDDLEWVDDGAHDACGGCGGARIVWPRVKVCRMIIAWPQCGHTKVSGVVPSSSSPPWACT